MIRSPRRPGATRFAAIAIIAGAACLLALSAAGESTRAAAVGELRPDLVALPPTEVRLASENGRTYLRFTTTSWNAGAGPLELFVRPDETPSNGLQRVYQRTYISGGGSSESMAGDFTWHPTHDHFHFEGYAVYELSAPGLTPRIGQKTSFCILDTTKVNVRLSGAPKRAVYASCGNSFQGMSVGWGDAYRYYLDGQQIEVTDLPAGRYQLSIKIDPNHHLIESGDAANNNISVDIDIDVSAGTASVVGSGRGRGNR